MSKELDREPIPFDEALRRMLKPPKREPKGKPPKGKKPDKKKKEPSE